MPIPTVRLSQANTAPPQADGDFVLYWMIAQRRPRWNYALQHALDRAKEFGKPLVVFEPLRIRYRWASDRMHQFVIEGMRENAAEFSRAGVFYFPYVEPKAGEATPLLARMAEHACTIITDEYPCFFLPKMVSTVAPRLPVRVELVDSNGLIPLRAADRTFTVAHSYRRWMQKRIPEFLDEFPVENPLSSARNLPQIKDLPASIRERWAPADFEFLIDRKGIESLPIDHSVQPGAIRGGWQTASRLLENFCLKKLARYDEDRNHPDEQATTGLSPHLHFGHMSPFEMVTAVFTREAWDPNRLGKPEGKNHGFWNTSVSSEALLDQLLTWREMGFNMTFRNPDSYDRYESLPDWAQKTLAEHSHDQRPFLYSLHQFETAITHDPLWNAAQRQLVREGVLQNYMRMLWGKKILHWTETPQQALEFMIELNNKYALDGRDPNSYSGIFWTLGRYDRAWGPKRPVFGAIRYMTSESAEKKLRLKNYLKRYGATPQPTPVQLF